MASRKSINIYISKYFMAVRNCINIYSGKYIGFGLVIETGGERTTTIIVDIFDIVQQDLVRDTGIQLKVDEEQWKIIQGSKRQAKWVSRAMSGLRLPDTHHAQKPNKPRSDAFRPETKERISIWWPTNDTTHACAMLRPNQDDHNKFLKNPL